MKPFEVCQRPKTCRCLRPRPCYKRLQRDQQCSGRFTVLATGCGLWWKVLGKCLQCPHTLGASRCQWWFSFEYGSSGDESFLLRAFLTSPCQWLAQYEEFLFSATASLEQSPAQPRQMPSVSILRMLQDGGYAGHTYFLHLYFLSYGAMSTTLQTYRNR